jgi:hypothetical protein
VQARSESISPENGADGKNAKPALPQLVVPGEFVKARNPPVADAKVVVVVELVAVVVVLELVVDVVVELVVDVVVDVVVDGGQGFGEQVPAPTFIPPSAVHCAALSTKQASKAPPGDDCLQHWICGCVVEVVLLVVDVVVELVVDVVVVELVVEVVVVELVVDVVVVVVVTGQLGSPGCPVQVHCPALHWASRFLVHVLACMPVKAPHAVSIWVAQFFLLHAGGDAAVAEETKTPAPSSATAANVTLTFLVIVLVIVESPWWPFPCPFPLHDIVRFRCTTFSAPPTGALYRIPHACQGFSPQKMGWGRRHAAHFARVSVARNDWVLDPHPKVP